MNTPWAEIIQRIGRWSSFLKATVASPSNNANPGMASSPFQSHTRTPWLSPAGTTVPGCPAPAGYDESASRRKRSSPPGPTWCQNHCHQLASLELGRNQIPNPLALPRHAANRSSLLNIAAIFGPAAEGEPPLDSAAKRPISAFACTHSVRQERLTGNRETRG